MPSALLEPRDPRADLRPAAAAPADRLEVLVREHWGAVRGLLVRLTGSSHEAEDLAQECFVRAQRALAGSLELQGAGARAWLRRVALNLVRDHRKGRGRARRREEEAGLERIERQAAAAGPAERLAERELGGAVLAALQRLPERLRVPLVLRVFEGLDYGQIAALGGHRPTTVRAQVMEARRELARLLRPHLEQENLR
jgi:RNA polymerase sigma-70 factor (ECF subfamily)